MFYYLCSDCYSTTWFWNWGKMSSKQHTQACSYASTTKRTHGAHSILPANAISKKNPISKKPQWIWESWKAMFYSVCFLSLSCTLFLSVEEYRSCRQVGYSHILWGNQDTGTNRVRSRVGKVEFRRIFTRRCDCKVLEIGCCVYCMSNRANLAYIPKTLVRWIKSTGEKALLGRGHGTWGKTKPTNQQTNKHVG